MEALRQLQQAFFAKASEFDKVLKMGRTHLQDAVPMSLEPSSTAGERRSAKRLSVLPI
jgi:aspartate ammonia-lyase